MQAIKSSLHDIHPAWYLLLGKPRLCSKFVKHQVVGRIGTFVAAIVEQQFFSYHSRFNIRLSRISVEQVMP